MTRNYYRTGNYKPDRSTCGSVIYNYDFDGYVSMVDMAERIISDWKFDERCRKLANNNIKKGVKQLHMENMENMIEFISGTRTATVTFTNQKHINRIKKIYEERKDDFKYFKENTDGSVCAKIPLKWIKINAGSKTGRVMTEEQKEAARIRLQKARENKNKNK